LQESTRCSHWKKSASLGEAIVEWFTELEQGLKRRKILVLAFHLPVPLLFARQRDWGRCRSRLHLNITRKSARLCADMKYLLHRLGVDVSPLAYGFEHRI
jgi:hypothetical protein